MTSLYNSEEMSGNAANVSEGNFFTDMLSKVLKTTQDVGTKYFEFKTLEQQIREKNSVLNRPVSSQASKSLQNDWDNINTESGDNLRSPSLTTFMPVLMIAGVIFFATKLIK